MATRKPHAPPKVRKTQYRYKLDHYSALYEIPHATIVKYYKKKYPLDNPQQLRKTLLAQTSSAKTNMVRLDAMAHMTIAPGPFAEQPPTKKEVSHGPAGSSEQTPSSSGGETWDRRKTPSDKFDHLPGLQREIARLEHETTVAYRTFSETTNPLDRKLAWDLWQQLLEQWGKTAKLAPAAEAEAGTLVKKADAANTWRRTFTEINSELNGLARRIATLPVFKSVNPVEAEQAVIAEVKRIQTILQAGEFVSPRDADS